MLTNQQYVENDELDLQRVSNVLNSVAVALGGGYDPGYGPTDAQRLTTSTGHQVFSVTYGSAPQGQAGQVGVNVAGQRFSLPLMFVLGLGALFILRR